jgi:hypothetical protein
MEEQQENLTSYAIVLSENLTVAGLPQNSPPFMESEMFITVYSTAHQWNLLELYESYPYPRFLYLKTNLILSCYLGHGLPIGLLSSGIQIKIL